MFRSLHKFVIVLFLLLPSVVLIFENEGRMFTRADEDEAEGEDSMLDDDVNIEDSDSEDIQTRDDEDQEEEEEDQPKGSPDADTTIFFLKPAGMATVELPAGNVAEFLVGFTNNGNQDFLVETLDASFRYPMDYTFYIQNFTTIAYHRYVKPNHQATLMYSFMPSDAFAGRPIGLSINLAYSDMEGKAYLEAVYNETVQVVEVDEGLDGETFFLYVFLTACVVLLLVAGQQFLSSFGKRKGGAKKAQIEMGANAKDIDYEWIPKETLNNFNKNSPGRSPGRNSKPSSPKSVQTPRQRKMAASPGRG